MRMRTRGGCRGRSSGFEHSAEILPNLVSRTAIELLNQHAQHFWLQELRRGCPLVVLAEAGVRNMTRGIPLQNLNVKSH